MQFEWYYPDWKEMAVTFSYDDGVESDRKLVRILNENNKKVLKRVVFADDAIYQYFSPEESPQEIKEEIGSGRPS